MPSEFREGIFLNSAGRFRGFERPGFGGPRLLDDENFDMSSVNRDANGMIDDEPGYGSSASMSLTHSTGDSVSAQRSRATEFAEPAGVHSELIFSAAPTGPDRTAEFIAFTHIDGRVTVDIVDSEDRLRYALTLTAAQIKALAEWLEFIRLAS